MDKSEWDSFLDSKQNKVNQKDKMQKVTNLMQSLRLDQSQVNQNTNLYQSQVPSLNYLGKSRQNSSYRHSQIISSPKSASAKKNIFSSFQKSSIGSKLHQSLSNEKQKTSPISKIPTRFLNASSHFIQEIKNNVNAQNSQNKQSQQIADSDDEELQYKEIEQPEISNLDPNYKELSQQSKPLIQKFTTLQLSDSLDIKQLVNNKQLQQKTDQYKERKLQIMNLSEKITKKPQYQAKYSQENPIISVSSKKQQFQDQKNQNQNQIQEISQKQNKGIYVSDFDQQLQNNDQDYKDPLQIMKSQNTEQLYKSLNMYSLNENDYKKKIGFELGIQNSDQKQQQFNKSLSNSPEKKYKYDFHKLNCNKKINNITDSHQKQEYQILQQQKIPQKIEQISDLKDEIYHKKIPNFEYKVSPQQQKQQQQIIQESNNISENLAQNFIQMAQDQQQDYFQSNILYQTLEPLVNDIYETYKQSKNQQNENIPKKIDFLLKNDTVFQSNQKEQNQEQQIYNQNKKMEINIPEKQTQFENQPQNKQRSLTSINYMSPIKLKKIENNSFQNLQLSVTKKNKISSNSQNQAQNNSGFNTLMNVLQSESPLQKNTEKSPKKNPKNIENQDNLSKKQNNQEAKNQILESQQADHTSSVEKPIQNDVSIQEDEVQGLTFKQKLNYTIQNINNFNQKEFQGYKKSELLRLFLSEYLELKKELEQNQNKQNIELLIQEDLSTQQEDEVLNQEKIIQKSQNIFNQDKENHLQQLNNNIFKIKPNQQQNIQKQNQINSTFQKQQQQFPEFIRKATQNNKNNINNNMNSQQYIYQNKNYSQSNNSKSKTIQQLKKEQNLYDSNQKLFQKMKKGENSMENSNFSQDYISGQQQNLKFSNITEDNQNYHTNSKTYQSIQPKVKIIKSPENNNINHKKQTYKQQQTYQTNKKPLISQRSKKNNVNNNINIQNNNKFQQQQQQNDVWIGNTNNDLFDQYFQD